MLAQEPEAGIFDQLVATETDLLTSAVAIWEASRGLAGARNVSFEESRALVSAFVLEFAVRVLEIGATEAAVALDAHQRFGRGRHFASLNMGDCFAYACAKLHASAILFKGEDIIHTDLNDATLA